MSVERLAQLQAASGFNPAPTRREMANLHVRFDDVTGGQPPCESAVDAALRRGERVALIGASGAGKSSVVATVLAPDVDVLAPLPIGVSIEEGSAVATDPGAFARHVGAELERWISRSLPSAEGELPDRDPSQVEESHQSSLGLSWLLTGNVSYELRQVTALPAQSATQAVERAALILTTVRAHGLMPVLVLDDTDKWLVPGSQSDADTLERRRGFFGSIVRLISEDLAASAVLSVHPSYLTDEAYLAALPFIANPVVIPPLADTGSIRMILQRRVDRALSGASSVDINELVEPDAQQLLFEHYAADESHDIRRRVLWVVHTALATAVDDGEATVRRNHVVSAITDTDA